MATTLEIINGISQIVANTYDGAHDESGEPIKIGLKREEGHPLLDSRVMDGFKVSFYDDRICIHYHSEVKLKDIYSGTFEQDTEAMIDQIAKFIKKEYKKVTGNALTLKAEGEAKIVGSKLTDIIHLTPPPSPTLMGPATLSRIALTPNLNRF
jgi:hypothetical protein